MLSNSWNKNWKVGLWTKGGKKNSRTTQKIIESSIFYDYNSSLSSNNGRAKMSSSRDPPTSSFPYNRSCRQTKKKPRNSQSGLEFQWGFGWLVLCYSSSHLPLQLHSGLDSTEIVHKIHEFWYFFNQYWLFGSFVIM